MIAPRPCSECGDLFTPKRRSNAQFCPRPVCRKRASRRRLAEAALVQAEGQKLTALEWNERLRLLARAVAAKAEAESERINARVRAEFAAEEGLVRAARRSKR
jgi:hypothetical protein